ncbi:hypothetical protein [Vagococcus intermedius]|nr:hypothetical protein [Vagococcus intermedius]WEG75639.1 hypothetical protein OL235_01225 [Vagococcus intermedius]
MIFIGIGLLFLGVILQGIGRHKAIKGQYIKYAHKPWVGAVSKLSLIGVLAIILALFFLYQGYQQI